MIYLEISGGALIQGDGDPEDEALKLQTALREFLKYYRAESGEIAAKSVEVTGRDDDQ